MKTKHLLTGVAAAAMMLTGVTLAQAADMPAPAPVYDWSGIYIGGHFGVGALITDSCGGGGNDTTNGGLRCSGAFEVGEESAIDLGALSESGFLGGGQVGWNWQSGALVFGIEGDISFVDWDDSAHALADLDDPDHTRASLDHDFLATVRGRIGWAVDNVMFFVTGGVAFLDSDFKVRDIDNDYRSSDETYVGGVVGAGLEWGFAENFSVKVEGLYAFFDENESIKDRSEGGGNEGSLNIDNAVIARVGFNWRFNIFR
jgi:outer membrane immunogenic protein